MKRNWVFVKDLEVEIVGKGEQGFACASTETYRALAKRVERGCIVLEIGCSYGKCTNLLAITLGDHRRIVGIDISTEVIDIASKSYPKISFVQSDVLRDPLTILRLSKELDKEFKDHEGLIVFIDIGGNRDMESVVKLIEFVNCKLQPITIIVKSEALCVQVVTKVGFDWKKLSELSNAAILDRRSSKKVDCVVYKRKYHPLKAPMRKNPDGISICRYHNYDKTGCRKFIDPSYKGPCPYDHEYCHACLRKGHRALECTYGAPLI